jgi:PAS domain S-box-containing protein
LKQYSSRYKGIPYMLFCFAFQILSLVLILLRGNIPVWISFGLANAISVCGIIFFYSGIETYTGIKSSLKPNLILLSVFVVVHAWFTFVKSDMMAQNLCVLVLWAAIFLQCSWSLLYRVPKSKFRLTFPVILVCTAFCLVCLARLIKFLINGNNYNDYLSSDFFDTAMILVSQILLILLIYSLEHMFGSQLLTEIKTEEEKFSKAFYTSPYGIVITRFSDGKIIETNKGFQNITGYSTEEIFSKTIREADFLLTKEARSKILEELLKTGKVNGRELQLQKKSGELITCQLSSEMISINNEKCTLSSINDITERKKYETELIKAKEKAEESDKLKTAFIHNLSHEIRTPLNAIIGFTSLLGAPGLDDESKQSYIDLTTRSSDHLMAIVSDIMEISNIEAGILKLNENEVNLNTILNDLYKQFTLLAVEKGIDLKVTAGLPNNSSDIKTDRTKLVQVISNLLSNALKFTEKGEIEFGYKLRNDFLEFHVSDTGLGIPEEIHDKIFNRFYQANYSSSRPYDGTGLGLSISKAYIELLGGKIWLESDLGQGTIMYFTIPYIKA